MSARIPRLAPGVRFRHDATRDAWVLLAPERLLLPDEIACAVLHEIDSVRDEAVIVDRLAEHYDAPRALIAGDVATLIDGLIADGVLRA